MPFFVPAWIAKLDFGWCLGSAAFFSIFAYGFIVVLMWKGKALRELSFKSISSNEPGMRNIQKGDSEKEEDLALP